MKALSTVLFAGAAMLALSAGCKKRDKEAEVNAVCDKIHDEDVAKCAGDKSCVSDVDATRDACHGLAKTVGETDKPQKSLADQVTEVDDKCAKGDNDACTTYGMALMLGKGVDKDEKKGFELVKKACDANFADGCEMLGRAYERGLGVTADKAQRNALMEKACTLGSAGGCRAFSMSLDFKDPKRIPLLQKACDAKDALGCMGLGAAYLNGGQGADKDLVKAKKYLQAACDLDPTLDTACTKAKGI